MDSGRCQGPAKELHKKKEKEKEKKEVSKVEQEVGSGKGRRDLPLLFILHMIQAYCSELETSIWSSCEQ